MRENARKNAAWAMKQMASDAGVHAWYNLVSVGECHSDSAARGWWGSRWLHEPVVNFTLNVPRSKVPDLETFVHEALGTINGETFKARPSTFHLFTPHLCEKPPRLNSRSVSQSSG